MLFKTIKQILLNLPRSGKRILVLVSDLLVCGISVWLAFGLRMEEWSYFQSKQWFVLIVAISFSLPLFFAFGLYREIFRYVGSVVFLSIVRAFIIYSGIIFCIFTIVGVFSVPRAIGVIQPILLFIGVGLSRYFIRYWLGNVAKSQKNNSPKTIAVIYGAGSAGRQLAIELSGNNDISVRAFIDDDPRLVGSTINGTPVNQSNDLAHLIQRYKITDVLLAIPSVSQARRSEIIASLYGCGVRVRTLPSPFDIDSRRLRVTDLRDLDMNDLLGRVVIPPQIELLKQNIQSQVILVTGAGGSIGSELCRHIIKYAPKTLILIDTSEHSLYLIYEELKRLLIELAPELVFSDQASLTIKLVPCLVSVRDSRELFNIFRKHQPATVFHAAAYKHVPLVEQNPAEGIRNNVYGTLTCAQVSLECGVRNFVLVSTDKAVRPTNIMGASKRLAELVLQAFDEISKKNDHATIFSIVRFGNVLGSSGSVAPLFASQIASGGPITLTHPEVTRYFMTIPEAAQLVIQASAMAVGGDVFVLDMGEPVKIYDLAVKMVYLSGYLLKDEMHPYGDIEIKVIGLRPGEKLYEELLIGENPQPTTHLKIMKAHEEFLSWDDLQQELEKLNLALDVWDMRLIREVLQKLVHGYQPDINGLDSREVGIF